MNHCHLPSARSPASVTPQSASECGRCAADERSPWCRPFPPDPPADGSPPFVRTLRRYYGPLRLLRPVHVGRTALAFTHRPAANSRAGRKSPGSRAESFLICPGASTAPGPVAACASATPDVAFPSSQQGRPPKRVISRLHSPGPPVPLSTLHPRCHHRRRMTRGQRGSLFLRCGLLPPRLSAGLSRRFLTVPHPSHPS